MHFHWSLYVLAALALVVFVLYLRVRQVTRMRDYWIIESFPKDGNWHDAAKILALVQEKHPNADRMVVNPTLERMVKRGILESRITDENYSITRQPVLDPFGQWRWLGV